MGAVHVTVTLTSLAPSGGVYGALFLVDTGSTDCMAPASELARIGIEPAGKMGYELADGSVREWEFGGARIEFFGNITWGRVVFGPEGSEPILGVTALESVGIVVDPVTRTLRQLPAIPMKSAKPL